MAPETWMFGINRFPNHACSDLHADNFLFERILYEETGGAIEIELRDRLYAPAELLYAVADGRIPIAQVESYLYAGEQPLWGCPQLPFLYSNGLQTTYSWLYDSTIRNQWQKSFNDAGVYQIAFYSPPPQEVWVRHGTITTVQDFQGMKLRTSSPIQASAVELLGASPMTMPGSEFFTAVERGVVDGGITSAAYGVSVGFHELCESLSPWPITPVQPFVVVVNKTIFDDLPAEVQGSLIRAGEIASLQAAYGADLEWKVAHLRAETAGCQVLAPSEAELELARTKLPEVYESWLERAGPEGQAWLDAVHAWQEADAAKGWTYSAS
jgi:TRAP-type C4-dicarboxylate transport system substrate-binding protein